MDDNAIDDGGGTPLVPGAHRAVRTLDPTEGPFAGTLVTHGEGVAVRVDAATLGGWTGWRFSGAEHIAAPIDVCRRRGGHDALLPWCTDRVLGFLVRRSAGGGSIAPGESSTLVVSLLRGLDELGEGADGVRTGTWWITDGGRPVFVVGRGPGARAGVLEILEHLTEQSSDKVLRRALGVIDEELRKTLTQPRLPRRLTESWEQSMLDVAAPQPLAREFQAPGRARDLARTVAPRAPLERESTPRLRADRVRTGEARRGVRGLRVIRDAVYASVRETLAWGEAVRRNRAATNGPQQRGSARSAAAGHLRRRSLLVAGAAAVIVLAAGLLFPEGEASGKAGDAVGGSSPTQPSPSAGGALPKPTPSATGGTGEEETPRDEPVAEDDPVAAVSSLLRTIADCRAEGDTSCAAAVAGDAVGVIDALGVMPSAHSTPELVDEYGDVAVMRLRATGPEDGPGATKGEGSDQTIVVLIRSDEKWLVRDVYDVADQPG